MILALSPHLDDVVFSVGAYLYEQAALTQVQCVTLFTASVERPTGFALTCQTDKGITPEVDYMRLRREEDARACTHLGMDHDHWPYPEAPHRGYESAAELFTGIRDDDPLPTVELFERLVALIGRLQPREVIYPHGAGDHVDHLQVISAVTQAKAGFPKIRFRQYYDMPYARKFSARYPELGTSVRALLPSEESFTRKVEACGKYASQLGYQFGGREKIADVLGRAEYLR